MCGVLVMHRATQSLKAIMALLAAVAVLVGCGSSSTNSEETTAGTTTASPESAGLDRLPKVPAATRSTRPPTSQGGAGGSAFLREVFDDVQAMWERDFREGGTQYSRARLTLFRDRVDTACGTQSAKVGPFYCPADHGVYLDTRFFDALAQRAGVHLGDFAQAFVVAHEVGHHVQTLLGITKQIRAAAVRDPAGKNARSVRFELQADCLAGIWKHSSYQRGQLDESDFADALRAAAVVGSDFQQLSATGTVRPEDWTHGSSRQRQEWLTTGFEQGKPESCDTFAGHSP